MLAVAGRKLTPIAARRARRRSSSGPARDRGEDRDRAEAGRHRRGEPSPADRGADRGYGVPTSRRDPVRGSRRDDDRVRQHRRARRRLPRASRRRRVGRGRCARPAGASRGRASRQQLLGPLANGDFVGRSAAAQRVRDFVDARRAERRDGAARRRVGLGQGDGVARRSTRASRRAKGPFVAVNCAALTESLIESELFGHEKGAFTGATEKKAGRFEMADRGTLFLDEVGELPLELQTKLLRVLEERRFERVGGQKRDRGRRPRRRGDEPRPRTRWSKRGTFREDLYYRLASSTSRCRRCASASTTCPRLADHFLARFRTQAARRITGFAPDAVARDAALRVARQRARAAQRDRARDRARRSAA